VDGEAGGLEAARRGVGEQGRRDGRLPQATRRQHRRRPPMPFSPLCPGEIREPLLPFAAAFFLSGKEQARRNDWVLSAHGWVDAAGSAEVGPWGAGSYF
jgi:hypothetical protein